MVLKLDALAANLKIFRILRRELLPASYSERHLASYIEVLFRFFRRSRRSTPRCLHRFLHGSRVTDMCIENCKYGICRYGEKVIVEPYLSETKLKALSLMWLDAFQVDSTGSRSQSLNEHK